MGVHGVHCWLPTTPQLAVHPMAISTPVFFDPRRAAYPPPSHFGVEGRRHGVDQRTLVLIMPLGGWPAVVWLAASSAPHALSHTKPCHTSRFNNAVASVVRIEICRMGH